jgi:hypothetical protein
MLLARMPFSSVDICGLTSTVAFYVLNPPFVLVKLVVPYREDDPDLLSWLQLEYPIAALVALLWWAAIWLFLNRRPHGSFSKGEA